MTALNAFTQPGAALMLADTAITDAAGRLIADGNKVWINEPSRVAVAWTGQAPIAKLDTHDRRFAEALAAAGVGPNPSQSAIMHALPAALRAMREENERELEEAEPGGFAINLLVALWNMRTDDPQVWAVHSDQACLGPGYTPFTLVRLHRVITTPSLEAGGADFVERAMGRPVDFANPASFDPTSDGVTLLEAQRYIKGGLGGVQHHSIGGAAQLTTITREGIQHRELKRWHDRIGKPIDPRATKRLGLFERLTSPTRVALAA